nr:MAG TPA: hypothetical protein [Caudoviricetes sp.]
MRYYYSNTSIYFHYVKNSFNNHINFGRSRTYEFLFN